MSQALTQQRIRIRFGKQGTFRFVGHLDLAKTWERVLRRAEFPLEYSQGFNPRPRMQFAAALPVGVTSESEYLDAWLTARIDSLERWIEQLRSSSPAGLVIYGFEEVPIKEDALPTLVTSADYRITVADIELEDLRQRVAALLAAPSLERTRNKKTYDLRPLVLSLEVNDDSSLSAQLVTGDQGAGRPDELVEALGLDPLQAKIHRLRLSLRE